MDSSKLMADLGITGTSSSQEPDISQNVSSRGLDDHACDACGRSFVSRMALRQHQLREHGVQSTEGPRFDRARDMKDGMPVCKHCGWIFLRRQGLQLHIEKNACPVLVSNDIIVRPQVDNDPRRVLVQQLRESDGHFGGLSDEHSMILKSHCILCNQWAPRQSSLLVHIKKSHGPSLISCGRAWAVRERAAGRAPSGNPCPYCYTPFGPRTDPKRHVCGVLVQ